MLYVLEGMTFRWLAVLGHELHTVPHADCGMTCPHGRISTASRAWHKTCHHRLGLQAGQDAGTQPLRHHTAPWPNLPPRPHASAPSGIGATCARPMHAATSATGRALAPAQADVQSWCFFGLTVLMCEPCGWPIRPHCRPRSHTYHTQSYKRVQLGGCSTW